VNLIDTSRLDPRALDPYLAEPFLASPDAKLKRQLLVNIDYAFGKQAEQIISALVRLFARLPPGLEGLS
jgi:hypothetical protein